MGKQSEPADSVGGVAPVCGVRRAAWRHAGLRRAWRQELRRAALRGVTLVCGERGAKSCVAPRCVASRRSVECVARDQLKGGVLAREGGYA